MDIGKLMEKAGEMQSRMKELRNALADIEATGEAAGGMVRITLGSTDNTARVHIDPSLVREGNAQILQDHVAEAVNGAKSELHARAEEKMKSFTGGMSGHTEGNTG